MSDNKITIECPTILAFAFAVSMIIAVALSIVLLSLNTVRVMLGQTALLERELTATLAFWLICFIGQAILNTGIKIK